MYNVLRHDILNLHQVYDARPDGRSVMVVFMAAGPGHIHLNKRPSRVCRDRRSSDRPDPPDQGRTKTGALTSRNGEELPIIPGMVAEVDVLIGKKTVLEYILKPVIKTTREALRTR